MFFMGGCVLLALGCGSPATTPEANTPQKSSPDRIVATHENGKPKQVYRYAGNDSLNRVELAYHPDGALLSQGRVADGRRDGEWKSFHANGQLWSVHNYTNGQQQGEYRVYYPDGTPRIEGQYLNDDKTGTWIFFTETGDTAKVVDFE